MKLLFPQQFHALDNAAIHHRHIPSILLMDKAAQHIFNCIEAYNDNNMIAIVCGPGNNGGDGLALARQLKNWTNHQLYVLMLAPYEQLTEDGKLFYTLCNDLGIEMLQITADTRDKGYAILEHANIIVDALFGIGLSRKIEGLYKDIIEHINRQKSYIISVDIPSGIDGRTGAIQGICIQADKTITFTLPKPGLYIYPGIDYTGEIQVVDIGIPKKLLEETKASYYSLTLKDMKELLPKRYTRSNKSTYGRVLMLGGKVGMSGAITLASQAALKIGAGLVCAAVPEDIHEIMEQKLTEVMTIPLQKKNGQMMPYAKGQLEDLIAQYDVVVIGPGMGRTKDTKDILSLVLSSDKSCVIDADALFFVRDMLEIIQYRQAATIITPHPGEMSRLTGIEIADLLNKAITVAQEFSKQNKLITVLKIERTVIADPSGEIYINTGGNNGMAKGGTGDILAGIIGGLLAQKLLPIEAAQLGVYLHARAGDIMSHLKTHYTLLPSDLYEGLDKAVEELVKG